MRGRGWRKWRKWVALTAVAGMLAGQTGVVSVWAEEGRESSINAGAVQEYAPEGESCTDSIASISGNDGGKVTETVKEADGSNVADRSDAAGKEDIAEGSGATEKNDAVQGSNAVEKDDVIQGSNVADPDDGEGMLVEDQMELQTESLSTDNAADNIASGKDGDITWVIDADGKLTVEGTGDLSGSLWTENFAWEPYREQIISAEINVTGMTNASALFLGCSNMKSLDLTGFETRNVTNMREMFYRCSSLTSLDVSNFDTGNVKDMGFMFSDCSGLTNLDLGNFDTKNVTDMGAMFQSCSSLTSLDISDLDTGNVMEMGFMFCNCSSLTSLNLSGLDTGNAKNMAFMFANCSGLAGLDVSSFETGNVNNMACMFTECSSLTSLDISNFDTKNVTSEYGMNGMFFKCNSLKSLNVSGLNTENVVNMSAMFLNCSSLESLDVSSFDTSKVTEIWGMFSGCSSLKSLDISNFDTRNVTNMDTMFSGCSNLTDLDIGGFDTTNVKDMKQVLDSCTSLQKVKAPKAMGTEVIELPAVFISANGVETQILSQGFCNTTLTRKDTAPVVDVPSANSPVDPFKAAETLLINQIKVAEAGSTVILNEGDTTLSNAVMKELLKKGDVSLKLAFTYNEQDYVIMIPAGAALDNDIPWYGPLYLAQQYGNSAGTDAAAVPGAVYEVKSGDCLGKIAAANNMTLKQLLQKNPQIKDANKIKAGQKINL